MTMVGHELFDRADHATRLWRGYRPRRSSRPRKTAWPKRHSPGNAQCIASSRRNDEYGEFQAAPGNPVGYPRRNPYLLVCG